MFLEFLHIFVVLPILSCIQSIFRVSLILVICKDVTSSHIFSKVLWSTVLDVTIYLYFACVLLKPVEREI